MPRRELPGLPPTAPLCRVSCAPPWFGKPMLARKCYLRRTRMRTPEYPMIPISKRWPATALLAALLQAGPLHAGTVLENDYVRVSRDEAPCAQAGTPGCAERVIVAMGEIDLRFGKVLRAMRRGEVAVFRAGESYRAPEAGAYFEGAIKPNRPPVQSPAEIHPAGKKYDRVRGRALLHLRGAARPGGHARAPQPQPARGDPHQPGTAAPADHRRQGDTAGTAERGELPRADHPRSDERRRHAAVELHPRVQAGALIALTLKKSPNGGR